MPAASGTAAQILALQRTAGNAAVASAVSGGLRDLPGGNQTRALPRPPVVPPPAPHAAPAPRPASSGALARVSPALAAMVDGAAASTGAALARAAAARAAPEGAQAVPGAAGAAIAALGSGNPLPRSVRAEYEQAYGYRLDAVRVHSGPVAARVTDAMGAAAVTLGDHLLLSGGFDPGSEGGRFVVGHELAHVVQARRGGAAATGRVSRAVDPAEREANAAALAALRGRGYELGEATGDDPQAALWMVLALVGLALGGLAAGVAAGTGHGVSANHSRRVRESRGTGADVLAWVPIVGSLQDIWEAESNLQLALGVGFLALDFATIGGSRVVVRALVNVGASRARVIAAEEAARVGVSAAERAGERAAVSAGEQAAERATVRIGGEDVARESIQQAAEELPRRGGRIASAETAAAEISQALSERGAIVMATEGGHAVMYANTGAAIVKVHGGPFRLRVINTFAARAGETGAQTASRVTEGAMRGNALESGVTAYAIIEGAELDMRAIERMPGGLPGVLEAIRRNLWGSPTGCGIVQGAALEVSNLAEQAARYMPSGGASNRFFPIQIVDHWMQNGVGVFVEGGMGRLLYGAGNSTRSQFRMAIFQAAGGRTVFAHLPANFTERAVHAAENNQERERAAATIRDRFGPDPSPEQVEAIRRLLQELIPGWLLYTAHGRADLRPMLLSAGISERAADAIVR